MRIKRILKRIQDHRFAGWAREERCSVEPIEIGKCLILFYYGPTGNWTSAQAINPKYIIGRGGFILRINRMLNNRYFPHPIDLAVMDPARFGRPRS